MSETFLTESDWQELLREIHNRQVIPIVGSELALVSESPGGMLQPVNRVLAPKLAQKLGLPANGAPPDSLNGVACEHLVAGKPRKIIYREVAELLDQTPFEPPAALLELASITDFDLFLTGAIDGLLTAALERQRPAFRRDKQVLAYDFRRPVDLPDEIGDTLVYHLLGNRRTYPNFAVWEEDYLEFICGLIQHQDQLKQLSRLLKNRYLLLLGAPFSDWIVRFFLFVVKGGRFTDRHREEFSAGLVDQPESLGKPLVFFFDKVVGATRIIRGDPAAFTCELARRWRAQYGSPSPGGDPLARIPEEMPRGAVFISYSRDDPTAATNLVRGLSAAGIPVWLDKQRLRAGENYERSLEHAVKSGCSFFLSLISSATETDTTRYAHRERRWAAQRHVDGFLFYIPVIIDDTKQPTGEPPEFAKIHFERQPGGEVTENFTKRLSGLVEEWRISGQPRA